MKERFLTWELSPPGLKALSELLPVFQSSKFIEYTLTCAHAQNNLNFELNCVETASETFIRLLLQKVR